MADVSEITQEGAGVHRNTQNSFSERKLNDNEPEKVVDNNLAFPNIH